MELVKKRAEAERVYLVAVAQKTLLFKKDGMAATLIDKLVKGDVMVSELKWEYDVADGVEKACLNSIKDIRSAIETYRSLLSWLKAEMGSQ